MLSAPAVAQDPQWLQVKRDNQSLLAVLPQPEPTDTATVRSGRCDPDENTQ